jgi:hypothetical protein
LYTPSSAALAPVASPQARAIAAMKMRILGIVVSTSSPPMSIIFLYRR